MNAISKFFFEVNQFSSIELIKKLSEGIDVDNLAKLSLHLRTFARKSFIKVFMVRSDLYNYFLTNYFYKIKYSDWILLYYQCDDPKNKYTILSFFKKNINKCLSSVNNKSLFAKDFIKFISKTKKNRTRYESGFRAIKKSLLNQNIKKQPQQYITHCSNFDIDLLIQDFNSNSNNLTIITSKYNTYDPYIIYKQLNSHSKFTIIFSNSGGPKGYKNIDKYGNVRLIESNDDKFTKIIYDNTNLSLYDLIIECIRLDI